MTAPQPATCHDQQVRRWPVHLQLLSAACCLPACLQVHVYLDHKELFVGLVRLEDFKTDPVGQVG